MPRKTRMFIPGLPCHLIQLGNNRSTCFFTEEDYQYSCLSRAIQEPDEDIHKIRKASQRNFPLGNDLFKQEIETTWRVE